MFFKEITLYVITMNWFNNTCNSTVTLAVKNV